MSNTQVCNTRCLPCNTATLTIYRHIPCGDLHCAPSGQREQPEISAFADRLDAMFYTTDKKLFRRCQGLHIDCIQLLG